MVCLLVAFSSNRTIGMDGGLPWRLPTDLRRFRELTLGETVLMGRRTFESLPDAFRPLPGRRNLVLSTDPSYSPAGAEPFPDLPSALAACGGDCFVIGGERAYGQALEVAERVYATEIEGEVQGDAFFPQLSSSDWRAVRREPPITENGHTFCFCLYERAA